MPRIASMPRCAASIRLVCCDTYFRRLKPPVSGTNYRGRTRSIVAPSATSTRPISLSPPTHRQDGGLRINSPHGAGFIGGSALHLINRMSIFLADINSFQIKLKKLRIACHIQAERNLDFYTQASVLQMPHIPTLYFRLARTSSR